MKSFELVLFEFPREAPFGIGFGLDISHCWVMFRSVQVYLTQCPAGYVNLGLLYICLDSYLAPDGLSHIRFSLKIPLYGPGGADTYLSLNCAGR